MLVFTKDMPSSTLLSDMGAAAEHGELTRDNYQTILGGLVDTGDVLINLTAGRLTGTTKVRMPEQPCAAQHRDQCRNVAYWHITGMGTAASYVGLPLESGHHEESTKQG